MFEIKDAALDDDFTIVTRVRPPAEEVADDQAEQEQEQEQESPPPRKKPVRLVRQADRAKPKAKAKAEDKVPPPRRQTGRFRPAGTAVSGTRSAKRRSEEEFDKEIDGTLVETAKRIESDSGRVVDVETVKAEAAKVSAELADKVATKIDSKDTIEGNVFAVEFNEMLEYFGIGEDEGVLLPRAVLLQIAVNTLSYMVPKLERAFHESKVPSASIVNAVNTVLNRIFELYKDLDELYREEELEDDAIRNIIQPSQKHLLKTCKAEIEGLRDDIVDKIESIVKDESQRIKLVKELEDIAISRFTAVSGHIFDTHRFFLDQVRMHLINRKKVRRRK